MVDDGELLRRYVQDHSDASFSELVERHIRVVYSLALRATGGNAHLAEEVTQTVFVDLARKAPRLWQHPVLIGWLFTSARFAASKAIHGESLRSARERAAAEGIAMMQSEPDAPDADRLRPMLDKLVDELRPEEREAVLLRFYGGLSLREVGLRLKLSEDGARSRVSRALAKLQGSLNSRGVRSGSEAITALLATQASAALPAGLAPTVVGLATGAAAPASAIATTITPLLMTTAKSVPPATRSCRRRDRYLVRAPRSDRCPAAD